MTHAVNTSVKTRQGEGTIIEVLEDGYMVKLTTGEIVKTGKFVVALNVKETRSKKRQLKFDKKQTNKVDTAWGKQQTYSALKDISEGNQGLRILPIWAAISSKADQVGHFAADVISKAMNGVRISDKQAWAVAFFAEKHNINA